MHIHSQVFGKEAFMTEFHHINLYQCRNGFDSGDRILTIDYLLYVHQGKGVFKIGELSFSAGPGDIFHVPAGVKNAILADNTMPFLLSGIEYKTEEGNIKIVHKQNLLSRDFYIRLIKEMIKRNDGSLSGKRSCQWLLAAFLEILREEEKSGPGEKIEDEKLLEYIQKNFIHTITCKKLTSIFHYHKSTIERKVKKHTGKSLREYQLSLRFALAKDLLLYSDDTIATVAKKCGYKNESFFCRQFREKTGITPKKYRIGSKPR